MRQYLKGDNIIIMGDINIDIYDQSDAGYNKLKHLCDVYNLSNLIKGKTCFMKDHQSSIDVILTNKPKSFQHTTVFESGLSDYHLMISTSLKVKLVRLKSKVITYRCYKNLIKPIFLRPASTFNLFVRRSKRSKLNSFQLSERTKKLSRAQHYCAQCDDRFGRRTKRLKVEAGLYRRAKRKF